MKRKVLLLTVALLLVGCMPQREITRQDLLAMSSHTFPNTTVDQVLNAASTVAKYLDLKYTIVTCTENQMKAERMASTSTPKITFEYILTASQKNNDVEAKLELTLQFENRRKKPEKWHEAFNLYFNRMESVLYGKEWVTCVEAEKKVENSNTLQSICFKAKDEVPKGIKRTPASQ
ncbi:MAG: hypothetical protein CVU51_03640 [Deltaproteobacteria bacterium HGW-Deltaproteobacteria-1]|jgi:hypothetical protein|nr:MAG: hypothetical protein CVU51_03640 [Deltaproteobacteria bacterium HGW-Deltaproteobacteria-1]